MIKRVDYKTVDDVSGGGEDLTEEVEDFEDDLDEEKVCLNNEVMDEMLKISNMMNLILDVLEQY